MNNPEPAIVIDKVRASKAGHAYHEAWAARSALELLLPSTDLVAITLEGFDAVDEAELGTGAVEIADLVRYFGYSDVAKARRVEIVQFKYSIASATVPVRAADVAKTLSKFAGADAQLRTRHGDNRVEQVVHYEFATNRPIHFNLRAAIAATIDGTETSGDVEGQQEQIATALKDYPHSHVQLLKRLALSGAQGSLGRAEHSIRTVLASWSEASDPDAEKRLLKLRNLIRIKAGPGSESDKRIDRIAVLAELEVDHEDRLYPTPDAFPEVGNVIERPLLDDIVSLARAPGVPLVLHGAGGMGKTVLMQSLAERMRKHGQVVLFDGFGAGRWRDPADGRHRPERTLVHLANLLAGLGLCDILLPISDITGLLRAFRRRLTQAVATARQVRGDASVTLILDAIDHAALAAQETATTSFAHAVMRSLSVDPIDGVLLIASCRSERLTLAVDDSAYRAFEIPPFTPDEAKALIAARDPSASPVEVAALLTRSGCNPRCLDNLLQAGRPYDPGMIPGSAEDAPVDVLDALLRKRLDDAREAARGKGARDPDIDLILAGLALLAPPVPIDELAAAHGISTAQVESFAADLAPLLERTSFGLMFRDEPTETLIRSTYGDDAIGRDRLVATLRARQSVSNYAARALPALLTSLRDIEQLIDVAYDERVPPGASHVSQRDIRLSRITAALDLCAKTDRRDALLRLLLEASMVAAGHERCDRFLYEHPDLAAVAGDAEAHRRLFSTHAGWPGGKHAALALASAFSGDMGEARRNARRSIDWHNWAATTKHQPEFDPGKASRQWDDIGFAYVEMLVGNDTRVAQFFARRRDSEAFQKFCDLFDLLERHQLSHHPPAEAIRNRLPRCRSRSRALWAAALQYSEQDATLDRSLLRRFAMADTASEQSKALAAASLSAAARAIDLGMTEEARAILSGAALAPPRVHDYDSYWPVNQSADAAVLAAGISSALRKKPVTLVDLAPSEFIALVPPSARGRGPAAFKSVLRRKLAEPTPIDGRMRRRRRRSLDHKHRSQYSRALDHRISPLIPYAQLVADIVRPPHGRTRREVVVAALDKLAEDVERISNYPYRDAKAYLARAGFQVAFLVADALGVIDRAIADRMAGWLATAPGSSIPQLTEVVARLSRIPTCHNAALQLASHIETQIRLDTDVESRIGAYGALARAVWRVGIEEAAAYFRRALDLAEAIGSDDFDRTNHLLELTGYYSGAELSPQAAHNLARILELNQSDDGKFPWIEYARTMVPVAGLATLAMLARLDDRDKARLGLSLGPALTVLVESGKLPADLAAAVFGLAEPLEAWTWHSSDFATVVLERIAPNRREWFFRIILVEIDRSHQLSPARNTIEALSALTEVYLRPESPTRARIGALAARRAPEPELPPPSHPEPLDIYATDPTDPDAIDRAILSEVVGPSGRRWPQRTLAQLAESVTTPAQRLAFVRAVVDANAASLTDKLHALDDFLPDWSRHSAALHDALPQLALRLAAKHARELVGSSSDAWGGWRGLVRDFNADRTAVVEKVITSISSTAGEIGGDSWLKLAAKLAPAARVEALAEGLERFLARSGETLPVEVGDGPWDARFVTESDAVWAIARLLWARLGHPRAAMRWRAAHAIRRLAAIDRFDVIGQLVARFETESGLPFVDAKLPFYALHARLWLLIALARIAQDRPDQIMLYRSLLERVAFSTEFPHVAMRSFAIDALRPLSHLFENADRDALLARLGTVNQSPFPHAPREDFGERRYITRPESARRPENAFHLDYDFNKYHVEELCRVFGCAGWEVEDSITRWVRRWDAAVHGMHDCPRSRTYDDAWSPGYIPGFDRYGGYLAWHGLMLVAGEMLQNRIVTGHDWMGDPWQNFLEEYAVSRPDRLWLADATDWFPLDLPRERDVPMPDPGRRSVEREDHSLLAPMLGIADGKLTTEWMPVAGSWSLARDTTVSMRSVLAASNDARATVMALLSEEPFFRWLLDDADEVERNFGRQDHSVRAWIESVQNSELHLDRYDPYAARTAMNRPAPAGWVRAELLLTPDDPITRTWSAGSGPAFRAEAWGAEGGRGEQAWEVSGHRLLVHRGALIRLLQPNGLYVVGALKVQRYHRGESSIRPGETRAFTHRSFVFTLDPRGHVWAPLRVSRAARASVAELDARERQEFRSRFRAIAAYLNRRPIN